MKTALALVAVLAATVAVVVYVWLQLGEVAIGGHGWAALGLGAAFSLLVGGGLMFLVFYSSRQGYDERAQGAEHDPRHGPPEA